MVCQRFLHIQRFVPHWRKDRKLFVADEEDESVMERHWVLGLYITFRPGSEESIE